MKRVKHNFETVTRKTVIDSLPPSIIKYCLLVYGITYIIDMKQVQKLQNFTANIYIGGKKRPDHATPFTTKFNWLKIETKVVLMWPYSFL